MQFMEVMERDGDFSSIRGAQLDEAEHGVSPGQACVFYDGPGSGARVLGGGYIVAGLRSQDQLDAGRKPDDDFRVNM